MLEDSVLERDELALHEDGSPESISAFGGERDLRPRTRKATSRNSSPQDSPAFVQK